MLFPSCTVVINDQSERLAFMYHGSHGTTGSPIAAEANSSQGIFLRLRTAVGGGRSWKFFFLYSQCGLENPFLERLLARSLTGWGSGSPTVRHERLLIVSHVSHVSHGPPSGVDDRHNGSLGFYYY
jgi:hypothetical protein